MKEGADCFHFLISALMPKMYSWRVASISCLPNVEVLSWWHRSGVDTCRSLSTPVGTLLISILDHFTLGMMGSSGSVRLIQCLYRMQNFVVGWFRGVARRKHQVAFSGPLCSGYPD